MFSEDLRTRTFRFALATIEYCRRLAGSWEAQRIRAQLFDSGTAVGANYRAAGRARSPAEFIAKLGTVVEEADESAYWLELLRAAGIDAARENASLAQEARELRAIFVASRATARRNLKAKRAARAADAKRPSGAGAESVPRSCS